MFYEMPIDLKDQIKDELNTILQNEIEYDAIVKIKKQLLNLYSENKYIENVQLVEDTPEEALVREILEEELDPSIVQIKFKLQVPIDQVVITFNLNNKV